MSKFASKQVVDGVVTAIIVGDDGLRSFTVEPSHMNYVGARQAMADNDAGRFVELLDVQAVVEEQLNAATQEHEGVVVELVDGAILCNGKTLHNNLTERTLQLLREGDDIDGMLKFIANSEGNPSFRGKHYTYDFLSHKHLPITEDGCFLAYKTVDKNFKDKYTGTIDNSVGQVVKMNRNEIDDDYRSHCSKGLHVGALSYAGPGGWYNTSEDNVVLVKVNPRDVVSVPDDCSFTKMRVCEYEVIGLYSAPLNKAQYSASKPEDEDWGGEPESWDEDSDWDDDEDELFDGFDPYELNQGDVIHFDYTHEDGTYTPNRHAVVSDVDGESAYCTLLPPEPNAGQTRHFYFSCMEDVTVDDRN